MSTTDAFGQDIQPASWVAVASVTGRVRVARVEIVTPPERITVRAAAVLPSGAVSWEVSEVFGEFCVCIPVTVVPLWVRERLPCDACGAAYEARHAPGCVLGPVGGPDDGEANGGHGNAEGGAS